MGEGHAPHRLRTTNPPEIFAQFVEDYRRRLESQLANEKPYFYPFKRVLFWGEKIGFL